ncbi:MAG: hypothetical protein ABJC36_03715 [Gemmatimonadales bacterium]
MQFTAPDAIAIVALAIGLAKILTGPIGVALAGQIRGRRGTTEDPAHLAEMEDLRGRLAEVEERLDFAERLLAQARETDQLHGGAQR